MKRLQQKCFAVSAGLHGLLLLILLIGSAFVTRKAPEPEVPGFILMADPRDMQLVEEDNIRGGGNPATAASQQPPQVPAATPPVEALPPPPKETQPEPPKPVRESPKLQPEERVKAPEKPTEKPPEPVRSKKPDPDAFDLNKVITKTPSKAPSEKTGKPSPFDFNQQEKKVIKTVNDPKASPNGEEGGRGERERKFASARAGALTDTLKRVQGGLSSVGGIADAPGPGGNIVSYTYALQKRYRDAWNGASSSGAKGVLIEIEIARDGQVVKRRIVKPSGNAEYDRAAQATIDRVRDVDPLPASVNTPTKIFRFVITPNELDRG